MIRIRMRFVFLSRVIHRSMPPTASPRSPRQARSRETQSRIVQALRELVTEKAIDDVSVQEIASRAGVSVGGFYARFASRDHALAHVLYEGYVQQAADEAARVFAAGAWDGRATCEIVRAYFRLMTDAGLEHAAILRELVRRTRENPGEMADDPAWTRFREAVHAPFLRLMEARMGEFTHPDPLRALRTGFSATSSALREALLFGHMQPTMGEIDPRTLVDELTRMLCAYLGIPVHFDDEPSRTP